MTDNVVNMFEADSPKNDKGMVASQTLLEMAKDESIRDVLIVAIEDSGDIRVVTSPMDARTAYFMTGIAGQYVLSE